MKQAHNRTALCGHTNVIDSKVLRPDEIPLFFEEIDKEVISLYAIIQERCTIKQKVDWIRLRLKNHST